MAGLLFFISASSFWPLFSSTYHSYKSDPHLKRALHCSIGSRGKSIKKTILHYSPLSNWYYRCLQNQIVHSILPDSSAGDFVLCPAFF
jgi:hypothetical protein